MADQLGVIKENYFSRVERCSYYGDRCHTNLSYSNCRLNLPPPSTALPFCYTDPTSEGNKHRNDTIDIQWDV